MQEILYYIIFGMTALATSPFLTGFINLFAKQELENKKEFKPKFDVKVTLVTVLAIVSLLYFHGITLNFFIYSIVSLMLIVCMFADLKAQIIPNEVNFLGFIIGLCYAYYKMCVDTLIGIDLLIGMITGATIFLLIAGFAIIVYKKEGMGGGDVKLMGMLGLFFGFSNIIQIFVLSFVVGAIVSILLLATRIKKMNDYIAFGPYIVVGAYITMFVPANVLVPQILAFLNNI